MNRLYAGSLACPSRSSSRNLLLLPSIAGH